MKHHNTTKRRRGISGIMQVAMIMGIVVIFAGALFVFANDIFTIHTTSSILVMQKVNVYDVNNEAYVSANVKNLGNQDVKDITLKVLLDIDESTPALDTFDLVLSPSLLGPGMSGSTQSKITYVNGTSFDLQQGIEIAIVLEGTTADGSTISESGVIRVR